MQKTNKIRVGVLYGGRSAEHEVSLQSARSVIQALDPAFFDVVPIGIDKQGNWFIGQDTYLNSLEENKVARLNQDNHTWFTPEWVGKPINKQEVRDFPLVKNAQNHLIDVIFPVVHGSLCEDGTLQGLLELANIPYVGCGVLSSALGMDKDISKRIATQAGIPVAPFHIIKKCRWDQNPLLCVEQIERELAFPVFIKPANTGSSIGVTKVKQKNQTRAAIEKAFQFDRKVIVEKALSIKELEVAVLESLHEKEHPHVSVVGEIIPKHEFYSYEAKYTDPDGAQLMIPADLDETILNGARELSKQLFLLFECEGMARVDLFYEPIEKKIYFNEINTIPGFTKISMYPKLMAASGISYPQLLAQLIQLAIHRHQNKINLIRNYEPDKELVS